MNEFNNMNMDKTADRFFRLIDAKQVNCDLHGEYTQQRLKVMLTGKELITECPACEAIKKEQENREIVQRYIADGKRQYHENVVRKLFDRSQIPERFTGRTFDNFIVTPDNENNLAKVKEFAAAIASNLDAGRGLIMFGNKGTGKSHLSCAIAEAAMQEHYSALFITADEIVDDVKAGFAEGSSSKAKINLYLQPDLLIIDEVVAGIDDKETRTIAKILNARYSNRRSTIIITNLELTDSAITLSTVLGERLIDRLRETNKALRFTGQSFRKQE